MMKAEHCISMYGLKKILFVSDFRPTQSKHVRPKLILWISPPKKKNLRDELLTVVKVTLKNVLHNSFFLTFFDKKCQKKNCYVMYR